MIKNNIIEETNTFYKISTKNLNKNDIIENVDKIDWYYYINLTDDLIKAGITTKDTAFAHLLNHGIYEDRFIKIEKNLNSIEDTINSFNSFLVVNCLFGLGNRLRALASAYSICKSKNYKLVINC